MLTAPSIRALLSGAALVLLASVLVVVAPVSAQGVPTCDGIAATIVGTEGNDVLIGTEGNDVIVGLGGNDVLRGLGGNDLMCGDNGRDRLFGGPGNDALFGGKKNDILKGDQGRDSLFGNQGNDRLFGGGSIDYLEGGSGTGDKLFGRGGMDTCVDLQATTFISACEEVSIRLPPTFVWALHETGSRSTSDDEIDLPADSVLRVDAITSFWYQAEGFYVIEYGGLNTSIDLCATNGIDVGPPNQTIFENLTSSPVGEGRCGDGWLRPERPGGGVQTCGGRIFYVTDIPVSKTGVLFSSVDSIIGADTSAPDFDSVFMVIATDPAGTPRVDPSVLSC